MRLRTKLIIWLVSTLVAVMFVHGYWSIQQDRENIVREMRVGMTGLSRSIQAALVYLIAEQRDPNAMQNFIDSIGRAGNIHGIVVYDARGKQIGLSASLTDIQANADLDPKSILGLDPRPVLTTGKSVDGDLESAQHPVYYRIEPIVDRQNRLLGAVVLGRRGLGYNLTLAARRNRIILTTSILIAVLVVVILFLVQRNFSRPIERLIGRMRTIGQGRWDQRIEVDSRNEIGALASEFNQMCERLQEAHGKLVLEQQERLNLERSLRQSDKLASVGQLAAGLAHEIGTPLNIIGGRAEFLLRRPRSPQEVDDNLQIIRSQIDRIAGIVRQLLEFSRRREPAFRSVELAPLVEKVIGLLEHKIAEKNVTVNLAIDTTLPSISADPDQLQQLFLNLFLNSLHALPSGGRIRIGAAIGNGESDNGAKRKVRIEFEDDGAGIAEEHVSQIFDPFFTTKDIGEGTGLGLSVSYGIVKDHGGEIRVESQPGQFTRFTILLPMHNDEAALEIRTVMS